MSEAIVIKSAVAEAFQNFQQQGRILFFSAPCGFGKTVLAKTFLAGQAAVCLHAGEDGFALPEAEGAWRTLLIDDFQLIQDEAQRHALCDLIRSRSDRRFLLLSRGTPPGWLLAFQYAGLMTVLTTDDLFFDRADIQQLLQLNGLETNSVRVERIWAATQGYPLGTSVIIRNLKQGRSFGPDLSDQCLHELFHYFEDAVYRRFDLPIRRLLLELAPFEPFDAEMARIVSGNNSANTLLDWLQQNTTMLRFVGQQRFRFWPLFRQFLLWEMDQEYSEEKRRTLFRRCGLYYELREDYPRALDCYTRGGDQSKVSDLLIRSAEATPGMLHYAEMAQYYHGLPEQEILASPSLMQGMSMLCALNSDYEGSERWYTALEQFANRRGTAGAAGRQARSRLTWLEISLPQRGITNLTEAFPTLYHMLQDHEISLPPFSATSTLPSILNGGKDFSEWTKNDELLDQALRQPLETVLGKDGVGLTDCVLAESKFEKGEDISTRLLALMSKLPEIQRQGSPDIEFAVAGLLIRNQIDAGHSEDALHTLDTLSTRFTERGLSQFQPNMEALRCRIALQIGDLDTVEAWYQESAPRDPLHFDMMKRYQYLTQAMAELALGRPDMVPLTLAPLEPYCQICQRHIDTIHLRLLRAIALYRLRQNGWRADLSAALKMAEEYHFVRTVSIYGAALLPLLNEPADGDESAPVWTRRPAAAIRAQAANYPSFLQPRSTPGDTLTTAELQVLRLLCVGKSNAEIGELLHIKLPTVKSHVSHILSKLGVRRRSEARAAAQSLGLVPKRSE